MTITLNGTTGITTPVDTVTTITSPASTALTIQSAGTTAMTVDTSQNVGIGTTTPGEKLQVAGGLRLTGVLAGSQASCVGIDYSGAARIISYGANTSTQGSFAFLTANSNASTTNQAVTIDTSGNLLVGTTSTGQSNTQGFAFNAGSGSYLSVGHASGTAGGQPYLSFSYNGSAIGSVTQNGTTAVAFNTSSDYRLKENIAPMTTGLATVAALTPVTYDWISDKSAGEGFIAHELQAVIPLAVTGEKDAINEDGSIRPQGVDYSKIVVHLVAAIQELSAKNDSLEAANAAFEARLAALEAK